MVCLRLVGFGDAYGGAFSVRTSVPRGLACPCDGRHSTTTSRKDRPSRGLMLCSLSYAGDLSHWSMNEALLCPLHLPLAQGDGVMGGRGSATSRVSEFIHSLNKTSWGNCTIHHEEKATQPHDCRIREPQNGIQPLLRVFFLARQPP